LDLDGCHDTIADGVQERVPRFICSFSVSRTAVLDKVAKDGLGERDML
jgi:hypothetical protein